MLITRENYEGFFLLYADDELCAPDKKLVEKFAADNADLQQELDTLKAAVLRAEIFSYPEKAGLFSNAVSHVHMQEKLLLEIDGELAAEESRDLRSLIQTDAAANTEYELLRQVKLNSADRVIFRDKYLLYRHTNNNVIIGRFVRWAAAAILLGIGLFYGLSLFNKTNTDNIAITTQPGTEKKEAINPVQDVPSETAIADIAAPAERKEEKVAIISDPINKVSKGSPAGTLENIARSIAAPKPEATLPLTPAPAPSKQDIAVAKEIIPQKNLPIISSVNETENVSVPVINESTSPQEKPVVHTASFAASLKNENRILYMDEDEVRRSKPFGFIRKVKKFVERTAQLKPGNTLRIAGFEFKGG